MWQLLSAISKPSKPHFKTHWVKFLRFVSIAFLRLVIREFLCFLVDEIWYSCQAVQRRRPANRHFFAIFVSSHIAFWLTWFLSILYLLTLKKLKQKMGNLKDLALPMTLKRGVKIKAKNHNWTQSTEKLSVLPFGKHPNKFFVEMLHKTLNQRKPRSISYQEYVL